MISMKMGGLSLPEIVGRYLGPVMKQSMRAVTLLMADRRKPVSSIQ